MNNFWTLVSIGASIVGACIAWVIRAEHLMGKFMTREEHERLCAERNQLTDKRIDNMHKQNQEGIREIQRHLQQQDEDARARGATLDEIRRQVAVLEETKRMTERMQDQRR